MKKTIFIAIIISLISACATDSVKSDLQSKGSLLSSEAAIENTGYKIGEQDLLGIDVFQVEDFSLTVRVNDHGVISLPLIGKIKASGKTSDQLQVYIASKLEENYLQNPHVTVFIKEYTSQRVTVEGSVNKPGIYPIKGRTTLLQTIAIAQGLTDLANADSIQLYRSNNNGKRENYTYDIMSIRSGEIIDPVIKGDDVIVVTKSAPRSIIKSIADTLRGFISFGNPL